MIDVKKTGPGLLFHHFSFVIAICLKPMVQIIYHLGSIESVLWKVKSNNNELSNAKRQQVILSVLGHIINHRIVLRHFRIEWQAIRFPHWLFHRFVLSAKARFFSCCSYSAETTQWIFGLSYVHTLFLKLADHVPSHKRSVSSDFERIMVYALSPRAVRKWLS